MAKTLSDHLLNTLEELLPYDFEKFKFKLQNTSLEKGHSRIPRGHLQMARPVKLANLLLAYYGEKYAVRLTLQILRATNQRLLAEELRKATGPEHLSEENRTDGPVQSSGENKSKSVKGPNVLEEEETRQCGEGSESLPASQSEVEKGSPKKSLGKRKDQRGPESLDPQAKPWAKSTTPLYRKSLITTQSPGEESRSAQLRRNASSAGRLQGLCSNVPGRREGKKAEAYLPSGKKRPKSLEITTYSSEREPPNPEALLVPEEATNGNPQLVPTLLREAIKDEAPSTGALEKGPENPETLLVPSEVTFRNMPSKTSLIGEEEHTTSWKENGTGSPETPGSLGKTAGSALSESCNPKVPLSLCEKPAPASEDPASLGLTGCKGRSQDKAPCPLCHTQEGTCVQGSCISCIAPGDPKTRGKCSPICSQCQSSLSGKSHGDQSPQPLPQCPRHMKQVQLLFCEDHREPICLICRLSQEHQGHRVRPIEEAALEYKEQIQKQLERLRELRGCVEEHRQQSDKKTENILNQKETQQQRVSSHLEKLYQFLEQQEQLFVTWLQELGQTIGKVRETHDTWVSQDIALLDELIRELEAKQDQPEWKLMQDIGVILHRAKMVTVSEPLATPPDVKEKIILLYQKSKFVEKSMQHFSEMLRSKMETFSAMDVTKCEGHWPGLPQAQDYDIVLYPEVEAGGSDSQACLQPQQAQGTPPLYETLSQNNKRKIRSFLKWKPSFLQN